MLPTSYPRVDQRRGIADQVIIIPELDGWDKDPTTVNAFVVPLADRASYVTEQPLEQAPIYMGKQTSPNAIDMNITAQGNLPIGLEFIFLARLSKIAFNAGHTKPEGATGKLFRNIIDNTAGAKPLPLQVIARNREATEQVLRRPGNKLGSINFPFATAGRIMYELALMGSGRELRTYPAGFPGSPTDNGYDPSSYFNMRLVINNKIVSGLTSFADNLTFNLSRTEVGANEGYAGALPTGYMQANGSVGLVFGIDGSGIESNFNLYDLAINKTEFAIEYLCADLPFDICTQFFRRRYWVRLMRRSPDFGGNGGLDQTPNWEMISSKNAYWPAELLGDSLGPVTIPASGNLGVKVNNGATITVPLTAGSRTIDQVVTELNAHGGFTAVLEADKLAGRLRIQKKTNDGSAGDLRIDTGVVNTAHTALGLTATVYPGLGNATNPVPLIYDVYNQLGTVAF